MTRNPSIGEGQVWWRWGNEGLDELDVVLRDLPDLPEVVVDFSIARGLDYCTGTVYEGKFVDWPEYGSICPGGRYEDLAGSFIRRGCPVSVCRSVPAEGLLDTGPSSPADVLVVLPKDGRVTAAGTAKALRDRGINVELYHQEDKVAEQVRYASRKGVSGRPGGSGWGPTGRSARRTGRPRAGRRRS